MKPVLLSHAEALLLNSCLSAPGQFNRETVPDPRAFASTELFSHITASTGRIDGIYTFSPRAGSFFYTSFKATSSQMVVYVSVKAEEWDTFFCHF